MTLGSRTRGGWSGLVLLTIVALGGCHAMPLGRLEDPPTRPQSLASAGRAALLSATVAMDPPSEMSAFEPVTAAPANLTSAEAIASAPTPLLDAALQKAKGLDEPPVPAPVPAKPEPAIPVEPPPSSMFTAPLPIELPAVNPPKTEPVATNPTPPEAATKEPEPARPEELWRDGVRKLNSLARAKLEQSGGSSSPWMLRSRILTWLSEPDINPDVDLHELDGVRAVLKALDDPPGADQGRKGDAVRSAVLVLEDKAPLEIVDLRLCRGIEKFGDFEPLEPPVRKAGEKIAVYCEVDGLRFEQTAAGFRTRLAGQIEIVPEGGGPPVYTKPLGTAEEICRKRRRDYYVAYMLVLPKPLPPGDYRIRLTEKDLTSDHIATREVTFFVIKD
jgi:hypothetical protein